jgi:hypothetical protein
VLAPNAAEGNADVGNAEFAEVIFPALAVLVPLLPPRGLLAPNMLLD